ncbi:MAG: CapA family protein [Candidatus Bathyarchaeota archaeon]|nr:CapA family protein [Candidatus Bathyarchaeota archaeon]
MNEFSLVATGDSLITMKQSVHSEPEFMRLVSLIREADVAFTNLEMNLHDYGDDCYPAAESGGTYTRAPPNTIDELIWMGFDIFSTANNHSVDYMYGGLLSTISYLEAAGVPHAGTGRDLAEARAPSYLEAEKGRVALISTCSSFPSFGRAGDTRRDLRGRPGLNPLRYETRFTAKQETLKKLREVEKELSLPPVYQDADSYHFLTHKFVVGEDVGPHTTPHKGDLEGNLVSIRDAARQADLVLVSLHSHEGRPGDDERPAEFMEEFARACIDNGAHCFLGHGHHTMRGIEIREGRPIFYGLGNFIFQNETVQKMPADFYERYKLDPYSGMVSDAFDARQKASPRPGYPEQKWFTEDEKYWMSVVPWMKFEGGRLKEMRLYPVELGQHRSRSQRGRPMMVGVEIGERILGKIVDLSKPYGTKITVRDGVGFLEL